MSTESPLLRRRVGAVVVLLASWPLVSCGGESADRPTSDPSRSLTATRSVTATVPSPTRSVERSDRPTPSPTGSPTTAEPEPEPTRAPSPTSTPTPTLTPTEETAGAQSSPATRSPQPTPSPTPVAENGEVEDPEGPPDWIWWLLGVLALALVIGVPVILRGRRRSAWRESLAEAEADVAWFGRELVPDLRRAPSQERLAGGWAVSSQRVVGLEDRLTSLEATAPDESGRERARTLRDAVRAGRVRLDVLATAEAAPEPAIDLDDVAATLESALRGPTPPAP